MVALAPPELFDVIIVGARGGGPGAIAQLSHTLARRYGLQPSGFTHGLERGGIEIHRGMLKTEAVAAARLLHELGAVAEVRAAKDLSGVLMLEPDLEAIPALAQPEPRSGPAAAAGVPLAPAFGVFVPTPPVLPPAPARPDKPAPAPRTAAAPEPRPATAPLARVEPPLARIEPPLARPPEPLVLTPVEPPASAFAAAPPKSGSTGRFAAQGGDERIELDLAAAGLARAPMGTSAINRGESGPSQSGSHALRPESSASSGRFTADPGRASTGGQPSLPLWADAAPGLLAADRVLSILLATTLGVIVGVIVAFGWIRGDAAKLSDRLETELQASVADPIGVEEGRLRPPEVIAKELAPGLEDLRQTFFLVWALIAIPIAGVGAIPRPSG